MVQGSYDSGSTKETWCTGRSECPECVMACSARIPVTYDGAGQL